MTFWVVVEWNQASGQPRVAYHGDTFHTREEAEDVAEQMRKETAGIGRRELYTVHRIEDES